MARSEFDDLLTDAGATPAQPNEFDQLLAPNVPSEFDELLNPSKLDSAIGTVKRTAATGLKDVGIALEDVGIPSLGKPIQDYAAGVISRNPSFIGSVGDIVEKPGTALTEGLSQAATQIPATLASSWAGAKTGAAMGGKVAGPRGAIVGGIAGGLGGAFAPNYVQEYGEIRENQKEVGKENIGQAAAGALAPAFLESAGDVLALGGTKLIPGVLKPFTQVLGSAPLAEGASLGARALHVGKEALKGAAIEGPLTEYPQTWMEQYFGNKPTDTPEAHQEQAVSAIMGAMPGAVIRGGAEAISPTRPDAPPQVDPTQSAAERDVTEVPAPINAPAPAQAAPSAPVKASTPTPVAPVPVQSQVINAEAPVNPTDVSMTRQNAEFVGEANVGPLTKMVLEGAASVPPSMQQENANGLQTKAEDAPAEVAPAPTPTPEVKPAQPVGGLTKEGEDLLTSVDAGGTPGFMTNNLKRIARINGITVDGSSTPNSIIEGLRQKKAQFTQESAAHASEVTPQAQQETAGEVEAPATATQSQASDNPLAQPVEVAEPMPPIQPEAQPEDEVPQTQQPVEGVEARPETVAVSEAVTPERKKLDKERSEAKKVVEKLFAVATAKGFTEGGIETPRVTEAEVKKALKGTSLSVESLKTGLLGHGILRDYSGPGPRQFNITRQDAIDQPQPPANSQAQAKAETKAEVSEQRPPQASEPVQAQDQTEAALPSWVAPKYEAGFRRALAETKDPSKLVGRVSMLLHGKAGQLTGEQIKELRRLGGEKEEMVQSEAPISPDGENGQRTKEEYQAFIAKSGLPFEEREQQEKIDEYGIRSGGTVVSFKTAGRAKQALAEAESKDAGIKGKYQVVGRGKGADRSFYILPTHETYLEKSAGERISSVGATDGASTQQPQPTPEAVAANDAKQQPEAGVGDVEQAGIKPSQGPSTTGQSIDSLSARIRTALGRVGDNLLKSGWFHVITSADMKKQLGQKFHKAWHGSPHDHDGFDSQYIGTGEDNATYGYGHYFTEVQDIAKWYRDKLSNKQFVEKSTGKVFALSDIHMDRMKYLHRDFEMYKGKLYEVELAPTEDEYLDWDKPLSEQSEVVRGIIKGTKDWVNGTMTIDGEELGIAGELRKAFGISGTKGTHVYTYFTATKGGPEAASAHLRSLGIRGIRYLDGTSRSAGEGNYNYVIFDDADVSIVAKYSKNGDVLGYHDPRTGQTYLVADNISDQISDKELRGLVLHEVGVHALQLGRESAEFQAMLGQFENMRGDKRVDAAFKRAEAVQTPDSLLTEEALGYYVEANPDQSIAKRVVAWFSRMLRKLGFNVTLTPDDMVAMARSALQNVQPAKPIAPVVEDAPVMASKALQVESPEFKRWFKDSKVVDADGNPLVVYHGTFSDFSQFDNKDIGFHFGTRYQAEARLSNIARQRKHGKQVAPDDFSGTNIMPVFLAIQNPLEIHDSGDFSATTFATTQDVYPSKQLSKKQIKHIISIGYSEKARETKNIELVAYLHSLGYDGLKYGNIVEGSGASYVAFRPEQIKSAIGNDGTFDATNPDIRFSASDPVESAAFKDWFGASKIKSNGRPEIVYHGSNQEIEAFSKDKLRNGKDGAALSSLGFFFARDKGEAKGYADKAAERGGEAQTQGYYVRVENPYVVTSELLSGRMGDMTAEEFRAKLQTKGHDGVYIKDAGYVVAFEPTQVKSIANRGTFDPQDERVLYSKNGTPHQQAVNEMKSFGRPGGFWLGLATRDMLTDMYKEDLPELLQYQKHSKEWESIRNSSVIAADELMKDWQTRITPDQAAEMADIAYEATLAQFDPDMDLPKTREQSVLKASFDAMNEEQKAMYRAIRDSYLERLEEIEQAYMDQIVATIENPQTQHEMLVRIQEDFESIRRKGPYFPLPRFGSHVVVAKKIGADGNEVKDSREVSYYATESAAHKGADEYRRLGFSVRMTKKKEFDRDSEQNKAVAKIIETARTAIDMASNNVVNQEALTALTDNLRQTIIEALPDMSYRKAFTHRKDRRGFSRDMRRAYAERMYRSANLIASLRTQHKTQAAIRAMQTRVDSFQEHDAMALQDVVNEVQKREHAMAAYRPSPLASAFQQFGFNMALGFNISSAAVNLLQTPMVAVPWMAARYGFKVTMEEFLRASKLLKNRDLYSKDGFKLERFSGLSGDERRMIMELVDSGQLNYSLAHDVIEAAYPPGEELGAVGAAAHKLATFSKYSAMPFHIMETVNREITALTSYRLARRAGASHSEAVTSTSRAIDTTHFDYQAQNRSRAMMGNTARVLMMFKQYSINMAYLIGRNAYQALKAADPEDRKVAAKTLGYMMAATFTTAGLLGLPLGYEAAAAAGAIGGFQKWGKYGGVAGGITALAVANALVSAIEGDDDDLSDMIRRAFADALGEDLGEAVTRGPMRLTGIDLAGRTGLNEMFYRTPQTESEGRDLYAKWTETILGPVAGYGARFFDASKQIADGEYQRAFESILPNSVKAIAKAGRYTTEGVLTVRGERILDEDLGPAELFFQMMGFTPARLAEGYERNTSIKNTETRLDLIRQRLINRRIQASGNDLESVMADIQDFNSAHPTHTITGRDLAMSMRKRAQASSSTEGGVMLSRKHSALRRGGDFANTD